MNAKNAIASCLVIALGIILALHFALFWMYGGVFIYENNRIILAVETVMSLAILFFGMERLLSAAGITSRRDVRRTASKSGDRLAGTSYAASAAAGTVSTVAPARASLMVHSSPFSANAGASCSSTGTPADVSPFLAHLPGAGTGTEVHTASRT